MGASHTLAVYRALWSSRRGGRLVGSLPSLRMCTLAASNAPRTQQAPEFLSWGRHFKPRLEAVGLGWVIFLVMRKTHSCMGNKEDIDPQVRSEQMGHSVDVNQNVYTRSSLDKRIKAVNTIEKALVM